MTQADKLRESSTAGASSARTSLDGGFLLLARSVWIAGALLTFGLFIVIFSTSLSQCTTICSVHMAGMLVFALCYFTVGAAIFWRKSDDGMALLASFALITFVIAFGDSSQAALPPLAQLLVEFMRLLGNVSFGLFFYLFPNGRFVPRLTRWFAIGWVVYWVVQVCLPSSPFNPFVAFPLLNTITFPLLLLSQVVVQIYRYRSVSNRIERQQTKWVVFGISGALMGFIGSILVFVMIPSPLSQGGYLDAVVGTTAVYLCMLLIPLSIGFAILRYRLWDIDLIIGRTLVYGILTLSIIGIYVLVVGSLGVLLQAQGNVLISLLATGLVAVLFQPARDRLQRGVNRLMYGDRETPYQAIARLGQRLEAALTSDAVLPTIVETTAQALKLPYAAIQLRQDEVVSTTAAFGVTQEPLVHLPLLYQGEQVGELLLAPRAPGEAFSSADRNLLEDLARQAGMAVHAVDLTRDLKRLTQDLQRSRTALVTLREEERRRLRRDLHDGLGSALASLNWRAGALRQALTHDPTAADAFVVEQQEIIRSTIADIRRLVYDLRPPSLDELGLIGALRERAAHATIPTSTDGDREYGELSQVSIEVAGELPPLPAANEVAAYRIVQEALTNVVRHAHATICQVRLSVVEGTLYVEVTDDGVGMPAGQQAGVGLHSMRERAAELGGKCHIQPGPRGGTQVCASLPFPTD